MAARLRGFKGYAPFGEGTPFSRSFLDTAGSFIPIDVPGSTSTWANGINNSSQITGYYQTKTGSYAGFLDSGGNFTTIAFLGAFYTQAYGINDNGQIVGTEYSRFPSLLRWLCWPRV